MMFNQVNLFINDSDFKTSDIFGGLPLACYLGNASKKENRAICEQRRTSQTQRIIRYYEGLELKNVYTDEPHQTSKISNKKQSP
jgi:hypothetical protein